MTTETQRHRVQTRRGNLCCQLAILLFASVCFADERLLMTLQLESSTVQWQEEFVLRLEIYGPPSDQAPQVFIDGLDQFKVGSQGTNLFQVPQGKTVKWVLTYRMTATENGIFKLGPATTVYNGQKYSSNILFLTVVGGAQQQAEAEKEQKEKEKEVPVPIVHTPAEVGDRVVIRLESNKSKAFSHEGIVATLKLLSELPVENLRFVQEPDFPGFLKYDFPFSSKPKAEKVQIKDKTYASYELEKFLLFPLTAGKKFVPAVSCELSLRAPSGVYPAGELTLNVTRTSNLLGLEIVPVPESIPLVGAFTLNGSLLSDRPQSKILEYTLDGEGELSTFDFPIPSVEEGQTRLLNSTTSAEIRGERLHSSRVIHVEVTPKPEHQNVNVPSIHIRQFDPTSSRASWLTLPPVVLQFLAPLPEKEVPPPLPEIQDRTSWILFAALLFCLPALAWRIVASVPRKTRLNLRKLFSRKKLTMQISRKGAQTLYQQILQKIAEQDPTDISLSGILQGHLPPEEWKSMEPSFRKLEWNAFASLRSIPLTYEEMKNACEMVERKWR